MAEFDSVRQAVQGQGVYGCERKMGDDQQGQFEFDYDLSIFREGPLFP
jgi:hypothetical protein